MAASGSMSPKTVDDHVARDEALGVELLQIGHGQGLDRLRLALGIDVIGRRGRQGVEEQLGDLGVRVGAAVLDVGQQQRLGLLELVLGDGRVQEGIGEQPGRLGKIVAQAGGVAGEREAAGAEAQHAADGVEILGDLGRRGAALRALVQQFRQQRAAAGQLLAVARRSAQHVGLDVHQRQVRHALDQHPQAVGKTDQADRARVGRLATRPRPWGRRRAGR